MGGARWDETQGSIVETVADVGYSRMPTIRVEPSLHSKPRCTYNCPLYRSELDGGSTLGRANNWIGDIPLASEEEEKWTERGVALFLEPPK